MQLSTRDGGANLSSRLPPRTREIELGLGRCETDGMPRALGDKFEAAVGLPDIALENNSGCTPVAAAVAAAAVHLVDAIINAFAAGFTACCSTQKNHGDRRRAEDYSFRISPQRSSI